LTHNLNGEQLTVFQETHQKLITVARFWIIGIKFTIKNLLTTQKTGKSSWTWFARQYPHSFCRNSSKNLPFFNWFPSSAWEPM